MHVDTVVSGRVADDQNRPLVGATVVVAGTSQGTTTDLDGNFSLRVNAVDPVLKVDYLGYEPQELRVSPSQTTFDIRLALSSKAIDDVVVVGYGVQNKRDVTTAISSIKAEDFADMPTADFRDAMAAKMPGVQVLTLGGQPDGNVSIRIRGIQSATSGNDPLYVIDGVPCDARAFSNLESSDIESLEVLKDASAAAIYGSRGSCGVILITTKRGTGERPVVSYDGQFSVSNVSKTIDMLDAYEFATIFKEARDGAYLFNVPTGSIDDPYEDRPQTYHRVDPLITAYLQDKTGTMTDTDWQDAIFRTAYSTKHSVSVSGRTKTLGYYIGANYLYREGTIIGSDFERYSLRANIDGKRNRLKYGVSFSPSYSKTNYISSDTQYGSDGVIASALMAPPVFPVYNADGSYTTPIRIFRIHMEEDAAKMVHVGGEEGRIASATESLVDYNRCGTPLIELVTEPDLRTPEEARLFMEKLRQTFLTLGISDCSLENGSMRCDGNVSLRRRGTTGLGTKTELKNINSFKSLHDGLEYEICRQAEVLEEGGIIYQETRHWEPSRKRTIVMRVKETADDYRLFPDPDLAPFNLTDEFIEAARARIPELPDAKRNRYMADFGLKRADAAQLAADPKVADFFEKAVEGAPAKAVPTVANVMVNLVPSYDALNPAQVRSISALLAEDAITFAQAREVLDAVNGTEDDPERVVDERGLRQVTDTGALEPIVDEVLGRCADQVQQYHDGNKKVIGFLVGQCMKAAKGSGNPKLFNQLLVQKLG